jgi:DNA-binding transcriptional MerR regulator
MHIGQISELSGYSQRMIRYLEDQGLIDPERSDSNLRRFADKDLTRILKIKRLKEMGFAYAEIKELIDKDESVLADKGTQVLKRHHEDAQELMEKIRQLEVLCFGQVKTKMYPDKITTYAHPMRTAYRIKKLEAVWRDIVANHPDYKIDVGLWKFGELQNGNDLAAYQEVEAFETFKASSIMVVLEGQNFLNSFLAAFESNFLHLNAHTIGKFAVQDLNEFFGRSEIIINYQIHDRDGLKVLHALIPYQAIFIASGEAVTHVES